MVQIGIGTGAHAQDRVVTGHAKEAEAHHQHAGNGAPLKATARGRSNTAARGFGGTHVGTNGDVHPDEAGGT